MHHSYYSRALLSCTTHTHAPLCNLVHLSCTIVHHSYYSRAPLVRHSYSCATRTRALLRNLVHHFHAPLSCTSLMDLSRAPLSCTTHVISCTTLVHHSHTLVHYPRAPLSCTTLMHHSHRNALSALLTYSHAPLNHS